MKEGSDQNYVKTKEDSSDLEGIINDFLENPKKAKVIADDAVRMLRDGYLTPTSEACYWQNLIKGYGSVSFEPKFFRDHGRTCGVCLLSPLL